MDKTPENMRADIALVKKGICESRSRAKALIESGCAMCNGKVIGKPSEIVSDCDELSASGDAGNYISRGELKLERAIEVFHADLNGKICMDIGASTGGFTMVCLKNGAEHVYSIDVGTGQFSLKLRGDSRVTLMENTNARYITPQMFPKQIEIAVMDVSFISIKLILPAIFTILPEFGHIYTLIKPQFEAGRDMIGKGGIIRSPAVHRSVLEDAAEFAEKYGWGMKQLTYSPITGGDGNLEFLCEIAHGKGHVDSACIREIVSQAHELIGKSRE